MVHAPFALSQRRSTKTLGLFAGRGCCMSLFAKKTAYEELERKETAARNKAFELVKQFHHVPLKILAELPTDAPEKQAYNLYKFYFNVWRTYADRKLALTLAQAELRRR